MPRPVIRARLFLCSPALNSRASKAQTRDLKPQHAIGLFKAMAQRP